MTAALYLGAVALAAALAVAAEELVPWRPSQPRRRPGLRSDLLFAALNAGVVGPLLVVFFAHALVPLIDRLTGGEAALRGAALGLPLWAQLVFVVVGMDLLQWGIHNLLHRVPWLWELHKVHHSVADGEMDWLVSLRFHAGEQVLYTTLKCLPLAYLGFSAYVILLHNLLVIAWGFFNHANLDLGRGRWRYVFNSPRMHLWHHARELTRPVNFGVIFSAWDWLFGTAYAPARPPQSLGFPGDESFPDRFLARALWPATAGGRTNPEGTK
jgi:sterol desaturase/sphingolipid hydroxylase (fatty acid hydroxylase superfamily)